MTVTNKQFQELWSNRDPSTSFCVPKFVCADGFTASVQASEFHYCSPRVTGSDIYTAFEVGFPSDKEDLIMEYAEEPDRPTETVYGWVPSFILDQVWEKHGGLVDAIAKAEGWS